jgi:hypothetical protein
MIAKKERPKEFSPKIARAILDVKCAALLQRMIDEKYKPSPYDVMPIDDDKYAMLYIIDQFLRSYHLIFVWVRPKLDTTKKEPVITFYAELKDMRCGMEMWKRTEYFPTYEDCFIDVLNKAVDQIKNKPCAEKEQK